MKSLSLYVLLLAFVFTGSFAGARKWIQSQEIKLNQPLSRFKPAPFTLSHHPFTIVVTGRNNGASVSKTLASVFSQNYENYRLIYIDDASDDGSFDLARDLIYQSSHLGQVTLVHNEERLGNLANIYRAVQSCQDEEIVVILEGKDWLAHEWVLERLNAYYADPDLWLTYGQYLKFPSFEKGICHEPDETKFRFQSFFSSHLKTFYAGLFKKIRESDFAQGGKFLFASAELAYMTPMLEMSKNHFQYIPEVLYIYNCQNGDNETSEHEMQCERFIRSLDPYPELAKLELNRCGESL